MNNLIEQWHNYSTQETSIDIDLQLATKQAKELKKTKNNIKSKRGALVAQAVKEQAGIDTLNELMELEKYKDRQKTDYRNWYTARGHNDSITLEQSKTEYKKIPKKTREDIKKDTGVKNDHKASKLAKEHNQQQTKKHFEEIGTIGTNKKMPIVPKHTANGKLTAQAVKDITAVLKEANLSDEDIALLTLGGYTASQT